jgi:tryptophan synthase alpha subunit
VAAVADAVVIGTALVQLLEGCTRDNAARPPVRSSKRFAPHSIPKRFVKEGTDP